MLGNGYLVLGRFGVSVLSVTVLGSVPTVSKKPNTLPFRSAR